MVVVVVVVVIIIVLIVLIVHIIMIMMIITSNNSNTIGVNTNGVNTNGAAAQVTSFDGLGEKVRPGTFGKVTVCQRENTKSSSVENHE